MRNCIPKCSIALAAIFALSSCSKTNVEPAPNLEPDKVIAFKSKRGKSMRAHIYAIEPDEMRQLVREKYGLQNDRKFDYREDRFDGTTLPYIAVRLKQLYVLRANSYAYNRVKRGLIWKLVQPEATGQPALVKMDYENYYKPDVSDKMQAISYTALTIYPDTALTSAEWVGSWLGVDASLIKKETGIDDTVMEDFIRFHEDGHAIGLNEATADRYATLSVLRKYGVTDRVVATLKFLADVRLARKHAPQYLECHIAIQSVIGSSLDDFINDVFIRADNRNKNFDPLEGRYNPLNVTEFDKKVFEALFQTHDPKNIKGMELLSLTRQRAEKERNKFLLDQTDTWKAKKFELVLEALDRLETLLISKADKSAYATMRPVSSIYQREFHVPDPKRPEMIGIPLSQKPDVSFVITEKMSP